MLYSALINVMVKAARRAGRSLKRDLGEIEHLQVSLKGPANFVSLADKRAEEMLYTDLEKARPGYGFLGEEGGKREGSDKSHTWIVDPLDGTTNFLHGIPQFAISIGLLREDTVIAGVIYNPANDELYIAERGKGAFLNDQRLRVAGRRQLNECVVACGLPHIGRGNHQLALQELAALQSKVAGFRRFGAASLDLAFVAAGRKPDRAGATGLRRHRICRPARPHDRRHQHHRPAVGGHDGRRLPLPGRGVAGMVAPARPGRAVDGFAGPPQRPPPGRTGAGQCAGPRRPDRTWA